MCCRYYLKDADPELAPILAAAERSPLLERFHRARPVPLARAGEVCPSGLAPVLATTRQLRPGVFPMAWGFHAPGRKAPIINARVETAFEKPTFQAAWRQHRCAVPASWYFEWQHTPAPDGKSTVATKYAIQPQGVTLTWLCGLYRIEAGLPQFVILTGPASEDVAPIHDRMPVILPQDAVQAWIDPAGDPTAILSRSLTRFLAEKAE